jgi:hypothetical protein
MKAPSTAQATTKASTIASSREDRARQSRPASIATPHFIHMHGTSERLDDSV